MAAISIFDEKPNPRFTIHLLTGSVLFEFDSIAFFDEYNKFIGRVKIGSKMEFEGDKTKVAKSFLELIDIMKAYYAEAHL